MKNSDNSHLFRKLKEIKIELSHKCNLRCIHCSSDATDSEVTELSFEQVKRILKEASHLSIQTVSFSGGEPLLWPELGNAVNLCLSLGIRVRIYTNGTTNEASSFFNNIQSKNISVIFSLHGFEDTHDRITAVPGSFQKTLATLRDTLDFGFHPEIHFVPMQLNYNEIIDFAFFLNSIGVKKISALRFVPHGRGKYANRLALSNSQHVKFRNFLLYLKQRNIHIRTGSPFNILLLNDQPTCTTGTDKLIISPDFRVYPCDAFKQIQPQDLNITDSFSSLVNHSLQDCWNNSSYLNFVRKLSAENSPQECLSCAKYSLCRSGCLAQKFLFSNRFDDQKDPGCLLSTIGAPHAVNHFE